MFLMHHFSSPWRALFLILILAVLVLMVSSCRDTGPGLVAPDGAGDIVGSAQTDTPDTAPRTKDITMPLVERIAGGKGTVKEGFDPDVGWVNVNTTASGKLNATAHLQGARPDTEFFVNVRVRYEDGTVDEHINIATLATNSHGNGNVQVQVAFDAPDGSTTLRRVAFRLRRPTPPNLLYVSTTWDVPLKQ